jgi:hypothetical protein|tara:strand:+ start:208 stop:663 length:456 start_codon:yes stop_codon:yes gene_type:complete
MGNVFNNQNGGKMIKVFHANEFGDNTKGYTKVAEVDVNTIREAFGLTNNIDGSWSRGPEFEYDGKKIVNDDYDPRIKVTADLPINKKTGEVMGLRSTSSGDVIYDGNKNKYWFLVPLGPMDEGTLYKTHGETVVIDNFDIDGFIYNDKEVA